VQLEHLRAIGASALTDERIAVPENALGESERQKPAAEKDGPGAASAGRRFALRFVALHIRHAPGRHP
jgi:hypothetical protein